MAVHIFWKLGYCVFGFLAIDTDLQYVEHSNIFKRSCIALRLSHAESSMLPWITAILGSMPIDQESNLKAVSCRDCTSWLAKSRPSSHSCCHTGKIMPYQGISSWQCVPETPYTMLLDSDSRSAWLSIDVNYVLCGCVFCILSPYDGVVVCILQGEELSRYLSTPDLRSSIACWENKGYTLRKKYSLIFIPKKGSSLVTALIICNW